MLPVAAREIALYGMGLEETTQGDWPEQAVIEPTIAQLKAHLGLPTYAALGVAGQALSLEQAVTCAGAVTLRLPQ